MGLLDIFSGSTGRNAAIWGAGQQAAGTGQQMDFINQGAGLSLGALAGAQQQARDDLKGQYEYGGAQGLMSSGRDNAYGAIAPLNTVYQQYGTQADNYYAPLGAEANRGFSTYGDAAGVNGAAGQDRARQNFRAGPGYQFTVNEGVNAATRAANASGMAASGNTLDATTRLGANLADKEWGDYMARLNPYLSMAPQIAGQRAGIQQNVGRQIGENMTNIAGLHSGYGRDIANLSQHYGDTLASLGTGYGTNQANIYTGQGQSLSNIAGQGTASQLGLGQAGFQAGQQADANTWNAGMQVANLAANALGKVKNPFG